MEWAFYTTDWFSCTRCYCWL